MLGKKLVSTTYKLSNSWALQFASSTEVLGIAAKTASAGLMGDAADIDLVLHVQIARNQVVVHVELIEHRLEFVVQLRLWHFGCWGCITSVMPPSRSTVTRFSVRGRSSVESQKSTAWRAIISSDHCGASAVSIGFSPRYIGACDLPTIWILPIGKLKSGHAEIEVVEAERLLVLRGVRLLRERQHGLAIVEHVVASKLVGPVGQPCGCLSLADIKSNLAELAAPQETTTMSP